MKINIKYQIPYANKNGDGKGKVMKKKSKSLTGIAVLLVYFKMVYISLM